MGPNTPKINIIVAACEGLGIGYKGDLPWRLKKELKYFSLMTKKTSSPDKQNVVIMGRKTWYSIPEKNRPLIDRINVVLSRSQKEIPGAQYTCSSFEEAINLLNHSDALSNKVEAAWVIGGYEIYKIAMSCGSCHRIYMTRIMKPFDCDVFFPEISTKNFTRISDPAVSTDIQEEDNVKYKYEVYESVNCNTTLD